MNRKCCEVKEVSLARNQLLGYSFYNKIADFLRRINRPVGLRVLNLTDTTVPVDCQ
jgi:hypothetical protein